MSIKDESEIQIYLRKLFKFTINIFFLKKFLLKYKDFIRFIFIKYISSPRDFLFKEIAVSNPVCCEIGVYEALFSERINIRCNPSILYLIDPWEEIDKHNKEKYSEYNQNLRCKRVREKFKNQINKNKIKLLRYKSNEAVKYISDNSIDFIYIDGDHSYDSVLSDLRLYYPKVKKGGIISGDDIRLNEVKEALKTFLGNEYLNLKIKNDQFYFKKLR